MLSPWTPDCRQHVHFYFQSCFRFAFALPVLTAAATKTCVDRTKSGSNVAYDVAFQPAAVGQPVSLSNIGGDSSELGVSLDRLNMAVAMGLGIFQLPLPARS